MLKIGIIGAGFTGLTAAYILASKGYKVYIFEADKKPGGLAKGFRDKKWKWTLEEHYHHIFSNDNRIIKLSQQVGQKLVFNKPKSAFLIENRIYRLDSSVSLLMFHKLAFFDRVRTGLALFYFKITPFWKPLEKYTSEESIRSIMGNNSWKLLWKPLFDKKFGKFAKTIPASWFWARIKKRTQVLGYPEGGFQSLTNKIIKKITKNGGELLCNAKVIKIYKYDKVIRILTTKGKIDFDKVICTLPFPVVANITKNLPPNYKNKLLSFKEIGAVDLVLSLKKRFLEDGTYWLNVNDKRFPFMAIIEHTNFIDNKRYNKEHILYIGNYLPKGNKYFNMSGRGLLDLYLPYLKKINKKFGKKWINNIWKFSSPHAQPIIDGSYSKNIPGFRTPVNNLYIANMQQVYPWDRGINYAIEMGERVARFF